MATSETTHDDARTPWANAAGWEYDLMRLLPPTQAAEVWARAMRRGLRQLVATWWVWPLYFLIGIPISLFILAIWTAAGVLGLGLLGRFLAEIVVHTCLGYFLHPYLQRAMPRWLRSCVRVELLRVVEDCLYDPQPVRA